MKVRNFEVGIQRTYYAAWLLLVVFYVVAIAVQVYVSSTGGSPPDWSAIMAFFPVATIAPWMAMHLIRWVYRGFVPSTAGNSK